MYPATPVDCLISELRDELEINGRLTRCAGCNRVFEVGDRFIEDTACGFVNQAADPEIDGLIAGIFGSSGGKVRFCEDCTTDGGDYLFETFYDDEAVSA